MGFKDKLVHYQIEQRKLYENWSKERVQKELQKLQPEYDRARLEINALTHLHSLSGDLADELDINQADYWWKFEKQKALQQRLYEIDQDNNTKLAATNGIRQFKHCKNMMIKLEHLIVHIWCKDIIKISNIGQQKQK